MIDTYHCNIGNVHNITSKNENIISFILFERNVNYKIVCPFFDGFSSGREVVFTLYMVSEQLAKHCGQYKPSSTSLSNPGTFSNDKRNVAHFAERIKIVKCLMSAVITV